jgi:gamma-glutamylcyclotransferase (GGCT)/AIG2-like uncharacterized protein YtfP
MTPDRMKKREVKFLRREHGAVLKGRKLIFNKITSFNSLQGYANIEPYKNDIVEGILYEIRDSDLEKSDKNEGYPDHYKKISLKVEIDAGKEVKVITYIANSCKIRSGLKPNREYLDHLLKRCDLLSEGYCERLRKW